MRRRGYVAALVVGGVLLAAPAAQAATLGVDDDAAQCPAAAFASIQAAVDAASPGDTVTVCPGSYVEGTGAAGTNAVTIAKNLTLRGAGADLVRVSPRRTNAAGGQIAEEEWDLANGVGDIVAVKGTPAAPVTADISGMTFDGDGVYVESGVVYVDAEGTVSRSRVTDVVTTEAADGYFTPGGWRDDYPGAGIAQVTTSGPARALTVDNVRVDRFNAAGIMFLGGDGVVDTSEIVGRILCQNFTVDGNCSAPGVVTTGPLFGQDGIAVVGGSLELSDSMVTSNLVNGVGAPVRGTTDGNENLAAAAGVRLEDADAAASLITRNNLVDNGYGVVNDSSAPVPAPANWWGLRYMPAGPNPGPAVSPATNPPFPENPVNGEPDAATGSTAVAFLPYRSGPQSDPLSGQYPNVQAPMPVNDAAPAIALAASRTTVDRGDTVTLTAAASDDFGIRRVTFADGATALGSDAAPPYAATYTVPADAPCAPRTFTATAQDSLGQTSTASVTVTVVGPNGCQPPVALPTVALPETLNAIAQRGTVVAVDAAAAAGVAKVELFLGARLVCTRTSPPYACTVVPGPADVGLQTIKAVVTDALGRTAVATRQVTIDRFKSRGVGVRVKEKRLKRNREKRTITATVRPPAGTTARQICGSGTVTFVVERRGRTFLDRQVKLRRDCTAKLSFTAKRATKKIHEVDARFGGNTVLQPAHATRRFS